MNIVIQSAHVGDATAIAEVHITGLRTVYPAQVLGPLGVEKQAQWWQRWLKRTQAYTVVARVDGAVVGFCTLHPARDEVTHSMIGEIPAIHVLPSHWRRGIGRQLCQQALAEAATRGFAEVVLWVLDSNERAQHFYRSLGFHPDGRTRVFLEHAETSLHEWRYRRKPAQTPV